MCSVQPHNSPSILGSRQANGSEVVESTGRGSLWSAKLVRMTVNYDDRTTPRNVKPALTRSPPLLIGTLTRLSQHPKTPQRQLLPLLHFFSFTTPKCLSETRRVRLTGKKMRGMSSPLRQTSTSKPAHRGTRSSRMEPRIIQLALTILAWFMVSLPLCFFGWV
jgi:hypothetical protein